MNRRAFLSLAALTPWACRLPALDPKIDSQRAPKELKADIVICGAGLGGIAAALAAAKLGYSVILTEENDWIGGQLSSQGVPPDEYPTIETFPANRSYQLFRHGVRDFYRRNYPLTEAARENQLLNPGGGSVSKLCHEPRVAVAVLLEQLAPYLSGRRIRLMQPYRVVAADTDGDRVRSVTIRHREHGFETVLQAPYFLDATELGDLLPLAKVEHVTGSESKAQTGEPRVGDQARPDNHQSFTCCFAIDYLDGEDHTIAKPANYDFWKNYVPDLTPAWSGKLLEWKMSAPATLQPRELGFDPTGPTPKGILNLWIYRRIGFRGHFADGTYPGDITLVNWPQNDYWLGNLFGGKPGEAENHWNKSKELSLSLLYWMQTEAPRPDGKAGWKGLRLRPDLMGTEDGLAQYPYVREARRIQAELTVTENQVGTEARMEITGQKRGEVTAEQFPDTVGIGSYRIDLHPSSGGDNYIDFSSLPFQIPLGCLLPKRVDNLIPCNKNIGTTHLTNGCYRLHPVEWAIGEAAGTLAAQCLKRQQTPRQLRHKPKELEQYQALLSENGAKLAWPDDVAKRPR